MAKETREQRLGRKRKAAEEREIRDIQRRHRRHGKKGFIVVRSAEGSPISKRHLDLLQPAE